MEDDELALAFDDVRLYDSVGDQLLDPPVTKPACSCPAALPRCPGGPTPALSLAPSVAFHPSRIQSCKRARDQREEEEPTALAALHRPKRKRGKRGGKEPSSLSAFAPHERPLFGSVMTHQGKAVRLEHDGALKMHVAKGAFVGKRTHPGRKKPCAAHELIDAGFEFYGWDGE